MVVAGGGGGGTTNVGGQAYYSSGGGAGGYRASGYGPSPLQGSAQELELGTYAVTVGAGGGVTPGGNAGTNGSNSVFNTITSAGGGGAGEGGDANAPGSNGCIWRFGWRFIICKPRTSWICWICWIR